jgi:hypothetical protein
LGRLELDKKDQGCPDYRQQAIEQLDALLEMGVKSIGWDFSVNIERAKEQVHNCH